MDDIDYLCSLNVDADFGSLHVWATPKQLFVDRSTPKRGRQPASRERIRAIPLDDIASIEIDAIFGESSSRIDGSRLRDSVTGVLVVLVDGEHILWRVTNKAPIEVKAELGRLIAHVGRNDGR